ncbi:hypothetical protein K491DRAFT_675791 [Lophiostoma macrostomum CBS 122681]|uniref:Uncharacterized protein n=1 Tax=Lophiostoma macrostomum CBS 122681 TaxID=1314788 RepID=A0A6A6THF8_9PLEO|nr:hypothetical protein K491DRAFT_675791 [Lophiostoma macrostomum CBS 122681]
MHELQSYPGLQFYIVKIDGTLKYSILRNGKAAKNYEISETDFKEDENSHIKKEQEADELVITGTEASAVGLRILLIKNEGRLTMEFEGKSGGHASWTFERLREVKGGSVYANAGIQTNATPAKESGTQTTPTKQCSVSLQTDITGQRILEMMSRFKNSKDKEVLPDVVKTGDKRKHPAEPYVPNKLARSDMKGDPWPKRMAIQCRPVKPSVSVPNDKSYITVNISWRQIWVRSIHGEPHCQTTTYKRIDLRNPQLGVYFFPLCEFRRPYDHSLEIFTSTKEGGKIVEAQMHFKKMPKVWTWTGDDYELSDFDIHDFVKAIVYCIDETSGRERVHNPK